MVPPAMSGADALRRNVRRRAQALVRLRALARAGRADCIALLVDACRHDKALMGLKVWRVEEAAFGRTQRMCKKHVAQTVAWCGKAKAMKPGEIRMSWLLDERTKGARLAAWLLAVCLELDADQFRLGMPDPYHAFNARAADEPNTHHT